VAHHLAVFRKELRKGPIFIQSYGHILAIPDFWEEGTRPKEDYVKDMECISKFARLFRKTSCPGSDETLVDYMFCSKSH
jgi:hypothetical protein